MVSEVLKCKMHVCFSCYGAETDQLSCCNTCDDVREAYRLKGWAFNNPKGIQQCVDEGFTDKLAEQIKEGCKAKGYIEVNKVGGNIHFAPGKSFQQHNVHGACVCVFVCARSDNVAVFWFP